MTSGYLERARQLHREGKVFEAAHLYRLAADQGNAAAQTALGVLYQHGSGGLPKDEYQAVRLFRLAADQGDADALSHLGLS